MLKEITKTDNQFAGAKEAIEAGKGWLQAGTADGKADQAAIYAMVSAWHLFEGYYLCDGERHVFTLASFGQALTNAAGKKDDKRTRLRMAALGAQLFGLPFEPVEIQQKRDEPDFAFINRKHDMNKIASRYQNAINRAYAVAQFLINHEAKIEYKKSMLYVAAKFLTKKPSSNASVHAVMSYENMKDTLIPLEGKKIVGGSSSVAELSRQAVKWRDSMGQVKATRKPKTNQASKPISFIESVAFVDKTLDNLLTSDETDIALTENDEARLVALANKITKLLAIKDVTDGKKQVA